MFVISDGTRIYRSTKLVISGQSLSEDSDGNPLLNVAAASSVEIANNGTLVGTRPRVNFIPGSNVTLTVTDNGGNNRVDVTINASLAGGTVSGTGTTNRIARFTGASAIGDSGIEDNGTLVRVLSSRQFTVGESTNTAARNIDIDGTTSDRLYRVLDNGTRRFAHGLDNTNTYVWTTYNGSGSLVDNPVTLALASGGALTFQRPVSLTSTLAVSGAATFNAAASVTGAFTVSAGVSFNVGTTYITSAASNTQVIIGTVGVPRLTVADPLTTVHTNLTVVGTTTLNSTLEVVGGGASIAGTLTAYEQGASAIAVQLARAYGDGGFRLVSQNGVATNTTGSRTASFGAWYSTNAWDWHFQWYRGGSINNGSMAIVQNATTYTRWHASGGISLLGATDPTAGVVHVAGRLLVNTTSAYQLGVEAASATNADIFIAGMAGVTNGVTYRRVSNNFEFDIATGRVRLRQFGDPVSSARLSVIGSGGLGEGVFGNGIEWGHPNNNGYRSTLGALNISGNSFIAFSAEHGTNDNTFRTRGIQGTVIMGDNTGGLLIRTLTANADNQTGTDIVNLGRQGEFRVSGAQAAFLFSGRDGNGTGLMYRTGNLNRLWDSTYGDSLTWNSAGVVNLPAARLDLAGARSLVRTASYLILYDPNDRPAIYLGGPADQNNYYDNTLHHFRNQSGGSVAEIQIGGGSGAEQGIRLWNDSGQTYLNISNNRTSQTAAGLIVRNPSNGALFGYVYGDGGGGIGNGQIGFLNDQGNWNVRVNRDFTGFPRTLVMEGNTDLRFSSTSGPALRHDSSGTSARITVWGGSGDSGFRFGNAALSAYYGWVLGFNDIGGSVSAMSIFPANGARPLRVQNNDTVEYHGGFLYVNPQSGSTQDARITARNHNLGGNAYVEATTVSSSWAFFRLGDVENSSYWDIAHRITGGHGDARLGFRWQGGGPQVWFSTSGGVFSSTLTTSAGAEIGTTLVKRTRNVPSVVISSTTPTGTFDVGDLWIQP